MYCFKLVNNAHPRFYAGYSLLGCKAIKLSNLKRRTVETACTHDFFLLLLRDQYECFEIFFLNLAWR